MPDWCPDHARKSGVIHLGVVRVLSSGGRQYDGRGAGGIVLPTTQVRLLVAGAVVLALSGLTVSASGSARIAAASGAAGASGHCDPVWFIGARGSGGTQSKSTDGMGPEIHDMYLVVDSDLKAKGLTTAPMAVDYAAASVDVLKPDAAVVNYLENNDTAAATHAYIDSSVDKYDASMDDGIRQAEADVAAVLSTCPAAKIIMAGYSQGAVAVHDAENYLAKNKPAEFAHIAGTLLLGDPDRVAHTKAKTFGTALGSAKGLRVYFHLVKAHDVPAPATTAEIANAHDIVANFAFKDVTNGKARKQATGVHTSYAAKDPKLLDAAANWIASKIHASQPGSWTAAKAPLPANAASDPVGWTGGLSCPSASYCAGVGTYTDSSGNQDGELLTWSGGTWTAVQAPLPADATGSYATLNAVSCPSASYCLAVGNYQSTSLYRAGLLLSWSGGKWTAAAAPGPADSFLTGVSCPSPSYCVAVGESPDYSEGVLLTWSGGTWTSAQAPLPADAASDPEAQLNSVSCPSASYCLAVGDYSDASGPDEEGLLLTWSDGTWTATSAPSSLGGAGLQGVSCPSASYCVAGAAASLLTWSDGIWTVVNAPGLSGAVEGLDGVSCSSASYCVAVGFESTTSTNGLLLTWSGGSWTATAAPAAVNSYVTAVSCPSSSYCVAAGEYDGGSGTPLYSVLLTRSG